MQRQLVQVDFSGGQDQRTAAKHVQPGKWKSLENVRWNKDGEVETRQGNAVVASTIGGVSLDQGQGKLIPYGTNGLLVSDGVASGVYAGSTNCSTVAGLSPCVMLAEPFPHLPDDQFKKTVYSQDVAYGGGYVCVVHTENANNLIGRAQYIVKHRATEAIVAAGQFTSSCRQCVVLYIAPYFIFVYSDASGRIRGRSFNTSTFALSAETNLRVDMYYNAGTSSIFDACVIGSNFVVFYQPTSATTDCFLASFTTAFAAVATSTVVDGTGTNMWPYGISGSASDHLWITWIRDNSGGTGDWELMVGRRNPTTLASTLAATLLVNLPAATSTIRNAGIVREDSTHAIVVWSETNDYVGTITGSDQQPRAQAARIDTTATPSSVTICNSSWIVSKPFIRDSVPYVFTSVGDTTFALYSDTQAQTIVLNELQLPAGTFSKFNPVACELMRFATCRTTVNGNFEPITSVASVDASTYLFPYPTLDLVNPSGSDIVNDLWMLTADFAHASCSSSSALGRSVNISSGLPVSFDGFGISEYGFIQGVRNFVTIPFNGTGSIPNGVYNYIVVFKYTDMNGQVHWSAPSPPRAVTMAGANDTVAVCVAICDTTVRYNKSFTQGQYEVLVYRTTIGSSGPYYLVGGTSVTSGSVNPYVVYDDGSIDLVIQTKPQLYTGLNGTVEAILPNVAPPSFTHMIAANSRLWGIAGNQRTVWFSKLFVSEEAPAFSDEFTLAFDDGARLIGLGEMDGRVYAFARDSIYVIVGQGPPDSGAPNDLVVQKLNTDRGCIDARSIVKIPQGLLFQSATGIYLLTRAHEVVWVGQEVQDDLETYPTITSAVVHPTDSVVIFTCIGASNGIRLVCDFARHKEGLLLWSKDRVYGQAADCKILSQANVGGSLYWLDSVGKVYKESTATYLDNGQFITPKAVSGNLTFGGLQGYGRCWRVGVLGTIYTAHDLKIDITTDHAAAAQQTITFPAATIAGLSLEQLQVHLVNQRAQSYEVTLTGLTPSSGSVGTGRGLAFSGLMFEVGVYTGPRRIPAAQRG